MKMMLRTIVLVGIVLVGDTMKAAETVYPVFPLGQIPAMNGKWNGGAWENIPEAIGFTSVSTGDVVSMRQTAFKMGRYGNDLYIAIKCDEPNRIR